MFICNNYYYLFLLILSSRRWDVTPTLEHQYSFLSKSVYINRLYCWCCFFCKEGIFVIMQLPKLSQTIHMTKLECIKVIMTTTWNVYSCNFIVYFIILCSKHCAALSISFLLVCMCLDERVALNGIWITCLGVFAKGFVAYCCI